MRKEAKAESLKLKAEIEDAPFRFLSAFSF
jgi:hypothetical protein